MADDSGSGDGWALALVKGRLTGRPKTRILVAQHTEVCHAEIKANGMLFCVWAEGDEREQIQDRPADSTVEVVGNLVVVDWETADGEKHTRTEIHARSIR